MAHAYAPVARKYASYLVQPRVPIADVAQMLTAPEFKVPRTSSEPSRWLLRPFELLNDAWAGRSLLEYQSSRFSSLTEPTGLSASELAAWRRNEFAGPFAYEVSQTIDGSLQSGTADDVVLLFKLNLLDAGWFEMKVPSGQVPRAPGQERRGHDFMACHLEPGALRANPGVTLEAAERAFAEFSHERVLIDMLPPGEIFRVAAAMSPDEPNEPILGRADSIEVITLDPPTVEDYWKNFVGAVVHPQSPHKELLKQQLRDAAARAPHRFPHGWEAYYREALTADAL